MPEHTIQRYCATCRQPRPFRKPEPRHLAHCILSILTLGTWLIVWALVCLASVCTRYRCAFCARSHPPTLSEIAILGGLVVTAAGVALLYLRGDAIAELLTAALRD